MPHKFGQKCPAENVLDLIEDACYRTSFESQFLITLSPGLRARSSPYTLLEINQVYRKRRQTGLSERICSHKRSSKPIANEAAAGIEDPMNHIRPRRQARESAMRMSGLALIAWALLTCCLVDQMQAQTVDGDAGNRPVLFLGNESLPPMSFMENGKPAGIVVDLVRAMANVCTVRWKFGS